MDRIIVERHGRVMKAVNNDPKTKNAMSPEFYEGFREVVEAAGPDPDVGAIVLTGAGGFFCSGGISAKVRPAALGTFSAPATVRSGTKTGS